MKKVRGRHLGGKLPETPEEELALLQGADSFPPDGEEEVSQDPDYLLSKGREK